MLGQVFKKPQKLSIFKESIFKEIEDLGISSIGIVAFISFLSVALSLFKQR
jgi:phospholipid/cholesterol/gamma-HCH transport system permease protein